MDSKKKFGSLQVINHIRYILETAFVTYYTICTHVEESQ